MSNAKIAILLATYNGEKYVSEQIRSILTQTEENFHIYIRDDLSADTTNTILKQFAAQYPSKITIVEASTQLGAKGNFSELMCHAKKHPYIMLCDQDDVWFQDKIARTLEKMQSLENAHGIQKPLLVHTDLNVVDVNLNIINSSFWRYSKLYPQRSHVLNRLMVQNVVTGCTVMLNQPLLGLTLPIPKEAIMHDWWMALTAAAFGEIGIVNASTIQYRQHGKNTLGAQHFRTVDYIQRGFLRLLKGNRTGDIQNHKQVKKFYERHQQQFSNSQRDLLLAYLSQPKNRWAKRRYIMLKYRFFKCGFLRNVAQFLFGIGF